MKSIKKSKIQGSLIAPPSKSLTIRAIISALLSNRESKITNPSFCYDALSTLNAVEQLGANIKQNKNELIIKGGSKIQSNQINCGESGLLIRLLMAIAPLFENDIKLIAEGSLQNRKLGQVENIFSQFGINCQTKNDYPPVLLKGRYKPNKRIILDASSGSQILSGLLMALPLLDYDTQINVENLKSKPYIDLTIDLIKIFGISINNYNYKRFEIRGNQKYNGIFYNVEGDWSSAAFLLIAAAINGKIEISNLNINSKQGDKIILDILRQAGADVKFVRNSINVSKSNLHAFDFDASDYPDLIPPLTVLSLNCKGKSKIKGVHRLLNKESNRLQSLMEEFNSLGASIKFANDTMIIENSKLNGGKVSSHNDHRIAMALSIAGLNSESVINLDNSICVNKSYPTFFEDLKSIGGKINE